MVLIGVEAGFATVRATAFDQRGAILAAAAHTVPIAEPSPGWHELDQDEWYAAVGDSVRELLPRLPATPEMLCLTAPCDGLWLVDEAGRPTHPAILPSDRRSTPIVADWDRQAVIQAVYRRAGYLLSPSTQAAILRWLLTEEPDSLSSSHTAFAAKDALLRRLTGARVTDISDASAPFLDVRTRTYDEELIDLLKLRPIRQLLPPIDRPEGSLWPLGANGAALTGLPEGLPVHAAPFDAVAAGLAAGIQGPRDAFVLLGPRLVTGMQIDRLLLAGEPAGRTVCLPRYDRWITLHTAASGMNLLDWLLPLAGVTYGGLDAVLGRTPPGAHGVMIVPPFDIGGETAPFFAPDARGRILGLTTGTANEDLSRAACEAIAFSIRQSFETMGELTGVMSLSGGGSRAPAFRQMLADVLGVPVRIAPQPEPAARGAVIAGMIAAGTAYDHGTWTAPTAEVAPAPDAAAVYDDLYARFVDERRTDR